jgi:hypothetical protein
MPTSIQNSTDLDMAELPDFDLSVDLNSPESDDFYKELEEALTRFNADSSLWPSNAGGVDPPIDPNILRDENNSLEFGTDGMQHFNTVDTERSLVLDMLDEGSFNRAFLEYIKANAQREAGVFEDTSMDVTLCISPPSSVGTDHPEQFEEGIEGLMHDPYAVDPGLISSEKENSTNEFGDGTTNNSGGMADQTYIFEWQAGIPEPKEVVMTHIKYQCPSCNRLYSARRAFRDHFRVKHLKGKKT